MNKQNLIILHSVNFITKSWKKKTKKKGLLKRLKNIEDKIEERFKDIKSKNENIKKVTGFVEEPLNLEAKGLIE